MRTTHRLDVHTATTRLTLAVLLACLPILAGPAATANDLCGATIVADLKLDHDLTCVGAGLIAGADGIKIDLNGYTITGSGSDVGIAVTGRTDVSIAGGTIRNFAVAVRVNTSTDVVIKQIEFVENPEGVDLQSGSVGNTIKDSVFRDSATRGSHAQGQLERQRHQEQHLHRESSRHPRVRGRRQHPEKERRLRKQPGGHSPERHRDRKPHQNNSVVSNVAGIEFLVTPTGSATGNDFKGNTIATNDCGVKGPTAGNSFKENSFEGNAADTCS